MFEWFKKATKQVALQRKEERAPTRLPVAVDDKKTGVTRDLSASGVYFETDFEYKVGSVIELTIDLEGNGNPTKLECSGRIVRVEQRGGGKVGVAVKMSHRNLKVAHA